MSTITKEQLIEDLKASTQNSSGMFEIGEETICALMSMLTNAAPQLPQPAVPDIATVETTYPDVQTNWQDAKMYAEGWNACRAAMLQGADDNSPVIPDGWVACSERMPGHSKTFLSLTDSGEYWTGYFDRTGVFWCDETKVENVTHWMTLPAAPQQEAKK